MFSAGPFPAYTRLSDIAVDGASTALLCVGAGAVSPFHLMRSLTKFNCPPSERKFVPDLTAAKQTEPVESSKSIAE